MNSIVIRAAREADLATVIRFQQGIVDAERPFDSTLREGGIRYYDLEELIRADNVLFVIAELDGLSIGCGFARIDAAKGFLKHVREGYLGLMYVDPAFRGRGVNAKILEQLTRWCRSQGATELRLEVYPDNASARSAYEKAGFTPYMLQMRLALPPDSLE
jgi:GNAT superfamily N-acetyltransferase